MASQTHIRAVNRVISASNLDRSDEHAALVAFARDLARILDRAEPERFMKVAPLYRSALRELRRAGELAPASRSSRVRPADNVTAPSALQLLREKRSGGAT